MISQGTVDQNSFGSGYGRSNVAASGRILETNVENLLRMAWIVLKCLRSLLCNVSMLKSFNTFFRSVTVRMMLIVVVSFNLFTSERNLNLPTAEKHVIIVPRFRNVLRKMSLKLQSN